MRHLAVWTVAALAFSLMGVGALGAPSLDPGADALPPDGCTTVSVAGCHHVHIYSRNGLFIFSDHTAESSLIGQGAPLAYVPASGVGEAGLPSVFPGEFVVWHDHTGVPHTATNGITLETAEVAPSAGPIRLNDFDKSITSRGDNFWEVPNYTGQGTHVLPYYCSVFLHTALGMHGVILVEDNIA